MNSSLLMPSAFFLILFWAELGAARRAGTATLLALGLALLIMIVVQNVQSLIAQARPGISPITFAGSGCRLARVLVLPQELGLNLQGGVSAAMRHV